MNAKLLSFSLLFFSAAAFAQLTVKPTTGGQDSYVYVKNQILYVKEKIHLTQNPSEDKKASIYLRDNGQLIQSGEGSTNSGNGFLSVIQKTDPTNAYAYYYWASPVGNSEALDTVPGNINFGIGSIYEPLDGENGINARKAATTTDRNGFNDPELTISTRWLYTWTSPATEAEASYNRINSNNAVPPGFGFTMKGVHQGTQPAGDRNGPQSNHTQLYEFRGRPNSGTFSIPVEGPDGSNQRMVLAGNPYPSILDLNRVFYDSQNEDLISFYYYDEDRSVMSHYYSDKPYGFATWVPAAGYDPDGTGNLGEYTAAPFHIWNAAGGSNQQGHSNNNNKTATRFAPIGQGILFAGRNPVQQHVYIKNSHRRFIKDNAPFHRQAGNGTSLSTEDQADADDRATTLTYDLANRTGKLRLYTIFDQALTRDMLLIFSNQATDGFDRGWDAPSPMGMKSDAWFPIEIENEKRPFVINSTNFDRHKKIPVSIVLHKQSRVDMVIAEEENRLYREVFLYDSELNRFHPFVKALDDANDPFADGVTLYLSAGEYHDRFFITFVAESETANRIKEELDTYRNLVDVRQNNPIQRLEIRNPETLNIKSLALYDMSGKLVLFEKNLGAKRNYSFYTGNLSDGVYIVKLITDKDLSIDYKAVILNK